MEKNNKNNRSSALRPIRFAKDPSFHLALNKKVDDYFENSSKPHTATASMYLKTVIVLTCFALSYLLLVFWATTALQGVLLSVFLGLSAAGIGVNIQHDASHEAYSNNPRVNKLLSRTLDLIGGSSYMWRHKHVRIHHSYVNIPGYDTDIDMGHLAHITPLQKKHWFHRWQQWYMWPLYSLLAVKWQFFDDFSTLIIGHMGKHRVPRPKGWELVVFILGKVTFFSIAFIIPLMVRPPAQVIVFYLITAMVAGITLSLIFILPHTVEHSLFPLPSEGKIDHSRDIHQIRVTADFARGHKIFTWLVGSLNYHREHHLFPRICHVHTTALAKLIDDQCNQAQVKHVEHPSFIAGIVSHFRFLKETGRTG